MYLTIKWCSGDSKGYIDYLPEDWFKYNGPSIGRGHEVKGPRNGTYKAKCDLIVDGDHAVLDYTKYSEFNKKHQVIVGIMELVFASKHRKEVVAVKWKDSDREEAEICDIGSEVKIGRAKKATKNPRWSRDELILALDLYLRNRKSPPGKGSEEVLELSEFLNRLGKALGEGEGDTYRNPNGVYMKMMNFRRFDPEYTKHGKKGLSRGNKDEAVVWDEFSSDSSRLKKIVQDIREATERHGADGALSGDEPDIQDAKEGRVLTRLHRYRERNRKLIKSKKKDFLKKNKKLYCEACEFDFSEKYGPQMKGLIDVHHTRPVHTLVEDDTTSLDDLLLLCPNCHRVVHSSREWLTIEQVKKLLKENGCT